MNTVRKLSMRLSLVIGLGIGLASSPVWAADCGDTAGAGGTRVACACGDTVITDTQLQPTDPVVDAGCDGDGLIIGTDGIVLNCDDQTLSGDGGPDGNGVVLVSRTGVTVEKCHVTAFENGIDLADSDDNTLKNNWTFENEGEGINLDDGSDGNTIEKNTVADNGSDGIILGEGVGDCDNNVIKDNTVTGNASEGIDVENGSDENLVEKNTVTDNGDEGICVDGSDDNIVKNNQANNNGGDGIDVEAGSSGNLVIGNRATDNDSDGIEVDDGADGNTLLNNITDGNDDEGIDIETQDNLVENNRGKDNGLDADGDNGLEVTGTGNTLVKNVFDTNAQHGICAVTGNIDGGANRGTNNGVPPDVVFDGVDVGEDCVVF